MEIVKTKAVHLKVGDLIIENITGDGMEIFKVCDFDFHHNCVSLIFKSKGNYSVGLTLQANHEVDMLKL